MLRPWKTIASRYLADCRIFRLREDLSLSPTNQTAHAFYVLDAPTGVGIIPVTRDGVVVLVRQYRHGLREVTLEIPGGLVDACWRSARRARFYNHLIS